jgi:hypothetical protein
LSGAGAALCRGFASRRGRGRLGEHRIEPVERQISDLDHGWRGPQRNKGVDRDPAERELKSRARSLLHHDALAT